MFDLGMTELLVIGIVALIVVGPKDLPVLFRNVGRFVGKARGMAREFSRAMSDAADETGVKDVAKGLKTASNPLGAVSDTMRKAAEDLRDTVDPTKFGSAAQPGDSTSPSSAPLSEERAQNAKRIQAASARAAAERMAREAQEAMVKAEAAEAEVAAMPKSAPPKDEA
ncbi:twin-arginine translocase subunit TatB [Epibacterium sp. SM1979]|uniref:Sec-independent protein translocase protein TatB n=1 Tax=Tritonibacter litoralis TaxID=2662264 RepID=A0A843YDF9_9RHOB|nr:Sec-independent protein translocase protein TatB [Tritonibacter litoralis]MQQ07514.1 twin-arginine translocase subunit TatB [Tritonibacter litoralis]